MVSIGKFPIAMMNDISHIETDSCGISEMPELFQASIELRPGLHKSVVNKNILINKVPISTSNDMAERMAISNSSKMKRRPINPKFPEETWHYCLIIWPIYTFKLSLVSLTS